MKSGRFRPSCAQLWPEFDDLGAISAEFGPCLPDACRIWLGSLILAKVWPNVWPKSGRFCPLSTSVEIWPTDTWKYPRICERVGLRTKTKPAINISGTRLFCLRVSEHQWTLAKADQNETVSQAALAVNSGGHVCRSTPWVTSALPPRVGMSRACIAAKFTATIDNHSAPHAAEAQRC